jgi:DNA-directed RNA polymerase specialized sigma24 family protein
MRYAARGVPYYRNAMPEVSSVSLAKHLSGSITTPSTAAIRKERRQQVLEALHPMEPLDREILTLRDFALLSNSKLAEWFNF